MSFLLACANAVVEEEINTSKTTNEKWALTCKPARIVITAYGKRMLPKLFSQYMVSVKSDVAIGFRFNSEF